MRSTMNDVNDHLKCGVDEWIEGQAGPPKFAEERKLDELKETLKKGDTLVLAKLSRRARSVGQIAVLVDALVNDGVRVICLKVGMALNGKGDAKTTVMLTMFGLLAEIEKDFLSERTKERPIRAR
ncbi:MAG: recombinase family protein [Desulfobacterales bacterium]|jgi:DNA invertase Pin-like site-specific DNA recombinase